MVLLNRYCEAIMLDIDGFLEIEMTKRQGSVAYTRKRVKRWKFITEFLVKFSTSVARRIRQKL